MLAWRSDLRIAEARAASAEQRARDAEMACRTLTDVVDRLTREQHATPVDPPPMEPLPQFPPEIALALAEQRLAPTEMRRLTRWARDQHRLGRDSSTIAYLITHGVAS